MNVRAVMLASALVLAAPVHAQDNAWQARLQPPASGHDYSARASLHLQLPPNLGSDVRARLALEVDAIDVTALASGTGVELDYTPLQAWHAGRHELRLVEYAADGSVVERGHWTFTVASHGTAAIRTRLHADLSLGASERVADHGLGAPRPARFSSDSSGAFGMDTQSAHWRTQTEVDLTQASPAEASASGYPGGAVQMAQFHVAAQSAHTQLMLGDQSLPYNGLVVSALSRRGVSGAFQLPALHARVGAFSMRSDAISGFRHGLGVGDPDHRVSGTVVDWHPLARADALTLHLAYASGRGAATGTGTYGTPLQAVPSGQATGLAADSLLAGQRLQLHAELAYSAYDFGTPWMPRSSDHAQQFTLSYQPAAASGGGNTVNSQTTLSYQSIGTYFRSLANPMATPDLRQLQVGESISGSSWSLQGSLARENDNVDGNSAIATVRTDRLQLAAGLFPSSTPRPHSFAAWLGTPYYNLSVNASRSRDQDRPSGPYLPTRLDIVSVNAGAQFSHPHWNWNLGLVLGSTTDHTGQQDDTRVFGPTLGVNVNVGNSGSLGTALQYTDTHDRTLDTDARDLSYTLYGSGDLIAGKLTAQFNFSLTRNAQAVSQFMGQPTPASTYHTRTLSGGLVWHVLAAQASRPGFDLSLEGSWNHGGYPSNGLGVASDSYQIFLRINLVLPWRHPEASP